MATSLETRAVTKIYKTDNGVTRAVDGVSVAVKNGEFVALVGPSGSGKTTLLAMLAALLKPSEGGILIDGQDLAKMSEQERTRFRREKIGFTFQANNLVPYLTALENVELLLRINGKYDRAGRERSKELMARLGLSDRMNNLPRQLSGGQQQRVAIARALSNAPALLLADEPTGNLDTRTSADIMGVFQKLNDLGMTIVMVTHELDIAHYTKRMVVMRDGKVVGDTPVVNRLNAANELRRLQEEQKAVRLAD